RTSREWLGCSLSRRQTNCGKCSKTFSGLRPPRSGVTHCSPRSPLTRMRGRQPREPKVPAREGSVREGRPRRFDFDRPRPLHIQTRSGRKRCQERVDSGRRWRDIVTDIVAPAEDERSLHGCRPHAATVEDYGMKITRLAQQPIIRPHMDDRMGDNINGPSLIRVPDWVEKPLGRYYLYFAHHDGRYIRLAYSDDLLGPWTMHRKGALPLHD